MSLYLKCTDPWICTMTPISAIPRPTSTPQRPGYFVLVKSRTAVAACFGYLAMSLDLIEAAVVDARSKHSFCLYSTRPPSLSVSRKTG